MAALDRDSGDRRRRDDKAPASMPPTPPAEERPYHAKRPHRKSRLGCRNCKARKVKCDEKKPSCRNCTLRKETCVYPPQPHSSAATACPTAIAASSSSSSSSASAAAAAAAASAAASASASSSGRASASLPSSTSAVSSVAALSPRPMRVIPTPVSPSVSSASAVSPATSTSVSLAQRSPLAPQPGFRRDSHDASSTSDSSVELVIVDEPPFKFGAADEYDMKLLWFYTTETYASFSIETGKIPYIDHILKSQIVKFAFQSPFLMDCILGLSALHMQSLQLPVPLSKAITYRARAFAGYRQAIEKADPKDYPALLACSLLLCALSSELFREADAKPLYIIDWMVVWRGIGLIFEIIPVETLYDSGLDKLFSRPSFDLNQAALYIPSNLLFMISSIREGDKDHAHINTYYDTLKFLGGLYRELEEGFSPVLSLRVITWFTFLPKPFVELARSRRPRVLVILAHYLPFLKLIESVWWLSGISDRGIQDIIDHLGIEWQPLLNVPRTAMQIFDRIELAKLIKGNHAWEPAIEKAPLPPPVAMVNDNGEQVTYDKERGWVPLFHAAGPAS